MTGILPAPGTVPLLVIKAALFCPHCGERHVEWDGDGPAMRWERRAHTTHRCHRCGGDFDVYVCGASDDDLNERHKVVADNSVST